MPLTGKQRRALRAHAHHIAPVVQIGHEGATDSVITQIDEALAAHELIKVKVGADVTTEKDAFAGTLAERTRSEVAQIIGHMVVLYRRKPRAPKVEIPTRKGEARRARPAGSKGRKPRKKTHVRKKTTAERGRKKRGRAPR